MKTKEDEGAMKQNKNKMTEIKINYNNSKKTYLLKEKDSNEVNKHISIYMLSARERTKIEKLKKIKSK